ncbi:MAG: hypothetical protein DRJ50_03700, partial [Actinobacteria bacterium]
MTVRLIAHFSSTLQLGGPHAETDSEPAYPRSDSTYRGALYCGAVAIRADYSSSIRRSYLRPSLGAVTSLEVAAYRDARPLVISTGDMKLGWR